jgi:hypothetical protein
MRRIADALDRLNAWIERNILVPRIQRFESDLIELTQNPREARNAQV